MRNIRPIFARHDVYKLLFCFRSVGGVNQGQAVGDAEHMGVYRNCALTVGSCQHDVSRLATNPGQRRQLLERARNPSPEALDQSARSARNALCLVMIKTARPNQVFEASQRRASHGLRRGVCREQRRRHEVDARVGALRRQDDGNEQLKAIAVLQRRGCMRIHAREAFENARFAEGVA